VFDGRDGCGAWAQVRDVRPGRQAVDGGRSRCALQRVSDTRTRRGNVRSVATTTLTGSAQLQVGVACLRARGGPSTAAGPPMMPVPMAGLGGRRAVQQMHSRRGDLITGQQIEGDPQVETQHGLRQAVAQGEKHGEMTYARNHSRNMSNPLITVNAAN
jgi:hypothetical protein